MDQLEKFEQSLLLPIELYPSFDERQVITSSNL
jgi:hypothetical protein